MTPINPPDGARAVIALTDQELADARVLAEQTLSVFARVYGHYNNTLNSHLRGKIGEIAIARWLTMSGIHVEAPFRDIARMRECDVIAGNPRSLRFDVKTWDSAYWTEMGRCIAVDQLPKLRAKADGVLWGVSSSSLSSDATVAFAGWSLIEDIDRAPRRLTGPKGKRLVDNYQLDDQALRPLDELLAVLRSP